MTGPHTYTKTNVGLQFHNPGQHLDPPTEPYNGTELQYKSPSNDNGDRKHTPSRTAMWA